MKIVIGVFTLVLFAACGQKSNPAAEAAQDIKAMGEQRDKTKEVLKQLHEAQEQARKAADEVGEAEEKRQ